MNYQYEPVLLTAEQRREFNEKIVCLIDSGGCGPAGITRNDIFNAYTGDGGLHGLERADYDSYHAYSEAKKEVENGQFFTPPPLCEFVAACLKLSDMDLAADLTCGMGNFFNYVPVPANAYGCELDAKAYKVARYLYPEANLTLGDIRTYAPETRFDYVLGNPPYHLRWRLENGTKILSHLYYCLKAADLLKPLGILAVIVPRSFLADDFTDGAAIKQMEERFAFLVEPPAATPRNARICRSHSHSLRKKPSRSTAGISRRQKQSWSRTGAVSCWNWQGPGRPPEHFYTRSGRCSTRSNAIQLPAAGTRAASPMSSGSLHSGCRKGCPSRSGIGGN